MRAKLSRTEPRILRFFERFLLFLVFCPPLSEWFFARFALQNTAGAFDRRGGDRLEQDSIRRCLDDCFRAVLDFKLPANPSRNDNLPFYGERDRFQSACIPHEVK